MSLKTLTLIDTNSSPSHPSPHHVNSFPSQQSNDEPSPWTQVVQRHSKLTSPIQNSSSRPPSPPLSINFGVPEHASLSEKVPSSSPPQLQIGNEENSFLKNDASLTTKSVWNTPSSNGVVGESEHVLGADLWPSLSEAAKSMPKLSLVEAQLKKSSSDGSASAFERHIMTHSPKKQTATNKKSNSAPNQMMPAHQRSFKHGGKGSRNRNSMSGGGPPQSSFAQPLLPQPPHPHSVTSHMIPAAVDHRDAWDQRPVAAFVPQLHSANEQMKLSRIDNYDHHEDVLHHIHGGWLQHQGNHEFVRDLHMKSKTVQPMPLVRPPTSAFPFAQSHNISPFPNIGFSDMVYFTTMPGESFNGMPFMTPGPYPPMYIPGPDLPFLIVNQIEYYFSEANLMTDNFLKSQMDGQGWVPIIVIANFRCVKSLTNNIQLILDSLRSSVQVEVQDYKVRKQSGWEKWLPCNLASPSFIASNGDTMAGSFEKLNLSVDAADRNGEPWEMALTPSSPMEKLLKT